MKPNICVYVIVGGFVVFGDEVGLLVWCCGATIQGGTWLSDQTRAFRLLRVDLLFSKILICLTKETNTVLRTAAIHRNRDDRQEVLEGLAVLLVVGHGQLNLLPGEHGLTHATDGRLVRAPLRGSLSSWRGLQEATVATHHLMGRVAGKLGEGVGDVDDGSVGLEHVTEDKGDRAVDGTEIDLRVWPSNDAKQDRHYINPAGSVKTRVYDGILNLAPGGS